MFTKLLATVEPTAVPMGWPEAITYIAGAIVLCVCYLAIFTEFFDRSFRKR